jgi:autotransporter passenger strand-loop-strand repeat protein
MSDTTTISSGIMSTGLSVDNGDFLLVSGTVVATIVNGGGTEEVQSAIGADSGGTASFTTVNSGGFEIVSAGGTANSTDVTSDGTQIVSAGGSAIVTRVDSDGVETVSSGGTAIVTTVSGAGGEFVFAGGIAIGTTLSANGFLVVLPGGAQEETSGDGTIATTGVVVYTPTGGTTSPGLLVDILDVSGGATDYVLSDGHTISTSVGSGGTEAVYSGGSANVATVSSGGFQFVFSGGTTISTTVSTGGTETISSSGTASFTTVSAFGTENVLQGGTAISTSLDADGDQTVSSGGMASFTTVNALGELDVLSSGTASSATVSGGGRLDVFSGGTASFTTVSSGGTQLVLSSGTAISTSVDNGGIEFVSSGAAANFTTVSSGGFQVVSVSTSATGTTLDLGGSIIVMDFVSSGGGTATLNSSTDVLSVTEGDFSYTQQLAGTYLSTDSVTLLLPSSDEFTGGTQVELTSTLCFCIDTLIATPTGQVKVQDLAVGDLVMTLRGAARPITWIGTGAVLATRGRRNAATPMIVHKGALADNVPTHDLRVTKGHSLYVDHVLIPAEFLVNHRSIEWDDRAQEVKLYHIELETHDVLIANGAPAESYRDDGNRWLFRNANGGWAQPPQEPCAPVLTGGKLVDQAWQRLLDRAGPRPGLPLTEDADLHLVVDGQRLDAKSCHGETLVFRLMARPETVRIVLRGGAPQELGVARDPRVLGVALWRIMLRQGPRLRMIEAEDASLAEGFRGYEPDNSFRWTDGDALLPAALYDGLQGGFELELHVACSARYGDDRQARAAA